MAEIVLLPADLTSIVPAVDESGARVIILGSPDVEVRIHGGNARQLQRLALAFQAAIEGDVPHV